MNTFETQPDPEFLAHLEWQVRTAARREKRFARPVPARAWRGLRAAAVILLSLALGAGGVFAAQRLQQSREASLRAAQWDVRRELGHVRLQAATTERDEARARFDAGVTSREEYSAAEGERARLQFAIVRLENEAAEVAQTGQEPQDRISAPLVGGRDFLRERLEIAAGEAHAEFQAAVERRKMAEVGYAAGALPEVELREAQQSCRRAQMKVVRIERQLALRAEFLDGKAPALQAEVDDLSISAECALADQHDTLDAARANLERVQALVSAGAVAQHELRTAQQRVSEAEAGVRLAELELDVLVREGQR